MPDLEIVIRTKAELAGAKAALESLEKQIGAAKVLGRSHADLEAQRSKAASLISAAEGSLGGGGMLGGMAAKLATFSTVVAGLKKAVSEYAAAESQVAGLDAALAQNGLLTDSYRERLQKLAGEFQKTTAIADDQWLGVLTRLTQFGADETNIDRYAEGVKNLAGIMGGDVQSAANAMSRAMQGNFEMFSRYGIRVEEAGTQTERMSRLMEQLAQRGGGQLEARASSLVGMWAKLKNGTSDLFESLGGLVARTGVLQDLLEGLAIMASWTAERLGGVIPPLEGLRNASAKTAQSANDAASASKRHAEALDEVRQQARAATEALTAENAQLEKQKGLADREASARMDLELAVVNAREKSGQLSGPAAEVARSQIRARFAAEEAQREDELLAKLESNSRKRLEALQNEISETGRLLVMEEQRLEVATKLAESDAQRQETITRIRQLESQLASVDAKIADQPTAKDGLWKWLWTGGQVFRTGALKQERSNLLHAIELNWADLRNATPGRAALREAAPSDLGSVSDESNRATLRRLKLDALSEIQASEAPHLRREIVGYQAQRGSSARVFGLQSTAEFIRSESSLRDAQAAAARESIQSIKGEGQAVTRSIQQLGASYRNELAGIRAEILKLTRQSAASEGWARNARTP